MLASMKSSLRRRSTSFLVLAIFSVLLLHGLQVRRHPPSVTGSPNTFVTGPALKRRGTGLVNEPMAKGACIDGYWKEVRASLGLPPLPSTVLVSGDFDVGAGELGKALGAEDLEGSYLPQPGHLNPVLRRRRLAPDWTQPRLNRMQTDENSLQRNSQAKSLRAGQSPGITTESAPDEVSPDVVDSESSGDINYDPAHNSNAYPDLFIASDAIYTGPRTPVESLAASFRAIAAKQLKAHRGGTRLRR